MRERDWKCFPKWQSQTHNRIGRRWNIVNRSSAPSVELMPERLNMVDKIACLIWGRGFEATGGGLNQNLGYVIFESPRAGGGYAIEREARWRIEEGRVDDSHKTRLTTWLIDQRQLGVRLPKVTTKLLEEIRRKPLLSVVERANRLLKYFVEHSKDVVTPVLRGSRSKSDGSVSWQLSEELDQNEAMAWTESTQESEVDFFIDYLLGQGWVEGPPETPKRVRFASSVTVPGYTHIEEQRTNLDSSQGFVAMWFNESMDGVYDNGIKPGVLEAGYNPLIISQKPDINKIDDEIIAEIRRSRFLVADFTHGEDGARGGVYFEAGFAQGLGIPVIYSCRYDMVDKLHFDTRQYAHIVWKDSEDLRKELRNRIIARIGEGPASQNTS